MSRQSQWLFEAPLTLEEPPYPNPEYYNSPKSPVSFAGRQCENKIPKRTQVVKLTPKKVACTQHNTGVKDPFAVLQKAVTRAIEMLDKTIDKLVNARSAVCGGATPVSQLDQITRCLLKDGLSVNIDNIRVWTAGSYAKMRSVAEVIRRLVVARNLIGSNNLRYSCSSPDCDPDDWAFVRAHDDTGNCLPGTPLMLIRLCRRFWEPRGVDPKIHAEFQAQTIIHEASHLTHCTEDPNRGQTIGTAECVAQFVAATNDSPIDADFVRRCTMGHCFSAKEVV
jgi:Lysine-specific metallo-endopeptidase